MEGPVADAIFTRSEKMRFDHLFDNIECDDGIVPEVTAYLWRRPKRIKRVNVLTCPGSKQDARAVHYSKRHLAAPGEFVVRDFLQRRVSLSELFRAYERI
jgi:hypothetical protein